MKQELIDNINWTGYRKEIEQAISNERLWAMGAGDDSMLHEQNIEEYTEELENILEGNYNLVIEKYEKTLGEDAAIDHFKGFFINNKIGRLRRSRTTWMTNWIMWSLNWRSFTICK